MGWVAEWVGGVGGMCVCWRGCHTPTQPSPSRPQPTPHFHIQNGGLARESRCQISQFEKEPIPEALKEHVFFCCVFTNNSLSGQARPTTHMCNRCPSLQNPPLSQGDAVSAGVSRVVGALPSTAAWRWRPGRRRLAACGGERATERRNREAYPCYGDSLCILTLRPPTQTPNASSQ